MSTKILGAFAEYILLPPHIVRQNTFHKPKDLSFEEASFLEPLSCVVHSIKLVSRIETCRLSACRCRDESGMFTEYL
jgi:threonine dehydrogenase-like Zn-dependent dehydrogenase